mmetsp:Transcript_104547/g.253762  ORF Transcript_104547/g.253762 Transcript_104547/m.253762 type:complete len:250 (-) Transcript_104547:545-1294(-)
MSRSLLMACAPRNWILLSLALLLPFLCQATPMTDLPATGVSESRASPSLRGNAVPLWWLSWFPDAFAYYSYWVPKIHAMGARVRAGVNKSEADPLWDEAADFVRNATQATAPGRRFVSLCRNGPLEQYAAAACAPGSLGNHLIDGIPVAAYYCGSTNFGINWTGDWWGNYTGPVTVKQLCNATPGTAYNRTGFCGRWTMKQLVLSTFMTVPLRLVEPRFINFASLDCLTGLGDCDLHYCQNCPGICGPK